MIKNVEKLSPDVMIDMMYMTTRTGMSEQYFYKLIRQGEFPKPVKFGSAAKWFFGEFDSWLTERVNESRAIS